MMVGEQDWREKGATESCFTVGPRRRGWDCRGLGVVKLRGRRHASLGL